MFSMTVFTHKNYHFSSPISCAPTITLSGAFIRPLCVGDRRRSVRVLVRDQHPFHRVNRRGRPGAVVAAVPSDSLLPAVGTVAPALQQALGVVQAAGVLRWARRKGSLRLLTAPTRRLTAGRVRRRADRRQPVRFQIPRPTGRRGAKLL
jgi:hypothetical protein